MNEPLRNKPMTLADIERHNRRTLECIAQALVEDLAAVRVAHGVPSQAYGQQVARSMRLIEGSLEALLTAALRDLRGRVRDE
jgi:hypothetical protein